MVVCLLDSTTRISLKEIDEDTLPVFTLEVLTIEGWQSTHRYSSLWAAIQGYILSNLKTIPNNPLIATLIRQIEDLSNSIKTSVVRAEEFMQTQLQDPVQLAILMQATDRRADDSADN